VNIDNSGFVGERLLLYNNQSILITSLTAARYDVGAVDKERNIYVVGIEDGERSSKESYPLIVKYDSHKHTSNCFFGACSAFTHVTACTLAESPSDPFHRRLRRLCCLRCRFDCYRVERTSSRAGVSPAEVQRLSRRTLSPTTHCSA
jgi:hypothetical protein